MGATNQGAGFVDSILFAGVSPDIWNTIPVFSVLVENPGGVQIALQCHRVLFEFSISTGVVKFTDGESTAIDWGIYGIRKFLDGTNDKIIVAYSTDRIVKWSYWGQSKVVQDTTTTGNVAYYVADVVNGYIYWISGSGSKVYRYDIPGLVTETEVTTASVGFTTYLVFDSTSKVGFYRSSAGDINKFDVSGGVPVAATTIITPGVSTYKMICDETNSILFINVSSSPNDIDSYNYSGTKQNDVLTNKAFIDFDVHGAAGHVYYLLSDGGSPTVISLRRITTAGASDTELFAPNNNTLKMTALSVDEINNRVWISVTSNDHATLQSRGLGYWDISGAKFYMVKYLMPDS